MGESIQRFRKTVQLSEVVEALRTGRDHPRLIRDYFRAFPRLCHVLLYEPDVLLLRVLAPGHRASWAERKIAEQRGEVKPKNRHQARRLANEQVPADSLEEELEREL